MPQVTGRHEETCRDYMTVASSDDKKVWRGVQLEVLRRLVQFTRSQRKAQRLLWKAATSPCDVSTMASEYSSEIVGLFILRTGYMDILSSS